MHGPPQSTAEVDTLVDLTYEVFEGASQATLDRKGNCPAHAAPWWNGACATAVKQVQEAEEEGDRDRAKAGLKRTIQRAKRTWANEYISRTNVWKIAAWRHGRRQAKIPALKMGDRSLSFDHEEMAEALSNRFFSEDTGEVDSEFDDDPPPRHQRDFPPLTVEELGELLRAAPNKSAPGASGIASNGFGQSSLKH